MQAGRLRPDPMTVERCLQIKKMGMLKVRFAANDAHLVLPVSMTLMEFWLRRKLMSEVGSVEE